MRSARLSLWLVAVAAVATGCQMGGPVGRGGTTGPGGKADSPAGTGAAGTAARPALVYCTAGTMPTGLATVSWNHWEADAYTLGSPHHHAVDLLATTTAEMDVSAWFTYGPERKDLEDEYVGVWIDDCHGSYRRLGEMRTDDNGHISFRIPDGAVTAPGVYDLYLRVEGDGSGVAATLDLFPPGTHVVAFDIDGTLTASNTELFKDIASELFEPLGTGEYVPKARADATKITWLRYRQGYPVVYLTGRPEWLSGITREWLDNLAFAPGSLMLTPTLGDAMPTQSGVGDYKARYLSHLIDMGFVVDAAYGNATTDIYAYGAVGVPKDRTYIVGPNGGADGTVNLGDGFTSNVTTVSAEAPVDQPFTW